MCLLAGIVLLLAKKYGTWTEATLVHRYCYICNHVTNEVNNNVPWIKYYIKVEIMFYSRVAFYKFSKIIYSDQLVGHTAARS